MDFALGMVVKPLVMLVIFVLIVAPVSWVLFKLMPAGRIKDVLFKVRTGEHASTRDKVIMTAGVLGFYAVFAGVLLASGVR